MSEEGEQDLSFERAETGEKDEGPSSCALCSTPILGVYYQLGGAVVCAGCRERKLAERGRGTPVGRFLRASALGVGAAILGAAVWYGIGKLTGYEFGLLAIVIGLLVGGAVRLGSYRRGGWLYQALAILLTYTSIVATYFPTIVEVALATETEEAGEGVTGSEALVPPADSAAPPVESAPEAEANEKSGTLDAEVVDETGTVEPVEGGVGIAGAGLALVLLFALAFAAPFLGGFENFMGWIIIAIGLYEAWKLNRREKLDFEGPFRVACARVEYVPETPPPPIEP
jgi:hypothetical protein